MPSASIFTRLTLILVLFFSFTFAGCSFLPWMGEDDEDDLAFEEDFPFEDGKTVESGRSGKKADSDEDDFFADDSGFSEEDDFIEGDPEGFDAAGESTDSNGLKDDVESLQSQQEALISKVRELEEILSTLEPQINAASERLEGTATESSDFMELEVADLKEQVDRLNEEIARIRTQRDPAPAPKKRMRKAPTKTPPEYDEALSAYQSRDYDESILLFENLALSNPPNKLKDNIVFWLGANYVALEMYEDAILQFSNISNTA